MKVLPTLASVTPAADRALNRAQSSAAEYARSNSATQHQAGQTTAQGNSAPVTLSSASRAILAQQSPAQDIDQAKVARVLAAIKAGEFKIDSSRIADNLIDNIRELHR
ncbi:flagellar biosynthesis anti-sigma factor FlgM [Corticimicrobacter populi]|uniref:flagellar biosynthesis anti-sigma factor FlgM n=1 Tax=Corticimicrobacter populi TaxID=2175229 RepID=UPI0013902B0B|nr:flagellar biosynthesis anti-sigma factor FlgM [Corticimicrobacter populi]